MMKYRFLSVLLVALAGAVLAAGCGSSKKSVSASDVAVVGDKTITKQDFDRIIDQACKSFETQGQKCPEPGTEQYTLFRQQAMAYLTRRARFEQQADDLGIKVTDADVEKELNGIKVRYWGVKGKCNDQCEAKYRQEIKKQGATDEQVHQDLRVKVLEDKLYEKVTADVTVTDADIEKYYKDNKEQYVQPASRQVRHILVKKKSLADRLYQQLQNGADFATLAKKYSEDPSGKKEGGKLPLSKGRMGKEFDDVAFALEKKQISRPVKTQYGWHIIQALSAVTKERVTPLKELKPAIRQQLLQQKKQQKMKDWEDETEKEFDSKTTYQVGYAPPATTTGVTSTSG
jgi:parvulin-like peptidyl-prolyl isomerase